MNQHMKTPSTKRDAVRTPGGELHKECSLCYRDDSASVTSSYFTNIGVVVVLIVYTLLGAYMFLAIEGSASLQQKTLATTSYQTADTLRNGTITPTLTTDLRAKTVENIWEITVSLNILYKENWTRLAAAEISRFQEQLVQRINAEVTSQLESSKSVEQRIESDPSPAQADENEWNFAKSFLYSLTVLTTIGYGDITPRTSIGKVVTIGYAVIGIPLTLLYLSVIGALLGRLVRQLFGPRLCCMTSQTSDTKEDTRERDKSASTITSTLHEPYYVRSPSGTIISASQVSAGTDTSTTISFQFPTLLSPETLRTIKIFAPIFLCVASIFVYIFIGASVLYYLENWSAIDGVYFCFMSLTTIGFGLGFSNVSIKTNYNTTMWFCSVYIVFGLAWTATCFNILHDEIVHRLRHTDTANHQSDDDQKPS